ncbi:MAG: serine hydrolase [Herpetosiphonaceae bacterium]|nr:serine hydrolase [Herpetosiphonaceae bacterium]
MRWCVSVVLLLTLILVPRGAAAAASLDPAIMRRWAQDDGLLANGQLNRSWTWGPLVERTATEPYAEAPNGQRNVWYWDKARMEVTFPADDLQHVWYVTTGLLVRELISGRLQRGNTLYEQHQPAQMPVAGDLEAPLTQTITYADLTSLASFDNNARVLSRVGQSDPITTTLAPGGTVGADESLRQFNVHIVAYNDVLGHNLPDVFVNAFAGDNLRYIAGYPLTEPYWVVVQVGKVQQRVLLQAFERRVLTYTPANPAAWQVEWGNVGRHYVQWRYGTITNGPLIDPNIITTAQPRALQELAPNAVSLAQQRQGAIGAAVYRLDTNELFTYGQTPRFQMYSTAKVPIMLTVMDQAQAQQRPLTGGEQGLIEQMIEWSDNDAATTLFINVGGAARVETFLHRNAINDTVMEDSAWGSSTTTTQDMVRLLAKLDTCLFLNQQLCTDALHTMAHVVPDQAWGISAGVANGTFVALKNGWYPDNDGWGVHSMGIVHAPNKNYTIAIFTSQDPSMAYGIDTVQQVAASVYAAVK